MFAIITFTKWGQTNKELVIGQEQSINEYAIHEGMMSGAKYDINLLGYNLPEGFDLGKWATIKNLFKY
jgi:hypothetical protein